MPDIAAGGVNPQVIYIILSNGGGSFAAGDLNGDTVPDIILQKSTGLMNVRTGNASGVFSNPFYYGTGDSAQNDYILHDLDADGRLDIISIVGGGRLPALNRAGQFAGITQYGFRTPGYRGFGGMSTNRRSSD